MTAGNLQYQASPGLWALAWQRLKADRIAVAAMSVVAFFLVLMLLSATHLIAQDWAKEVAVNYAPPSFLGAVTKQLQTKQLVVPSQKSQYRPSFSDPLAKELGELGVPSEVASGDIEDPIGKELAEIVAQVAKQGGEVTIQRLETLPLGADRWGRDIVAKLIKGSETSIFVGLAAALVATLLGTLFGALAGFFGKWVDDVFNWFYSVFTSIPYLLLIFAIAAVLQQRGMMTIILILGLTGWTGIFRLVRAEYLKHKAREYVQAADAIGASNSRRMFVHILPNIFHVILVQLSIHAVGFIKAEVILSFLGFGVPVDVVSWGSMLNEAQGELILGYWWQLAAAGLAMAILVTAFSMFTDALRDALDPKLK